MVGVSIDSLGQLWVRGPALPASLNRTEKGTRVGSVQSDAAPGAVRDADGVALIAACLADDAAARRRFQAEHGPLVYRFAACQDGAREVEPGDFYVYVFEDDRLFRRLRTYRGVASLGAFLRGYVLPGLLQQFQEVRLRTALDTVSLDADDGHRPTRPPGGDELSAASAPDRSRNLLAGLTAEKRVLVKLLYIEDFDLEPEDIQHIAARSGRPVCDVVERIEAARQSVRRRESARGQRLDEAESAAQWILRYEHDIERLAEQESALPPKSTRAERLREQRAELERKHAWREAQHQRAVRHSERAVITLAYREIADILAVQIGTVSAQIARVRDELRQRGSAGSATEEP